MGLFGKKKEDKSAQGKSVQKTEQELAEKQPTEEQPAEKEPTEEQATEKRPAEKQPAEKRPAEGQPGEEQPTEGQTKEQGQNERKVYIRGAGGTIVTKSILDGTSKLKWLFRQEGGHGNGWIAFGDRDSQEYVDDANNMAIVDFNTLANIEPTGSAPGPLHI